MRSPVWMDTVTVNGEDLRLAQGMLFPPTTSGSLKCREGVRPGLDLKVSQQLSPNNTVVVGAGRCVVNGDTSATQGSYICTNNSATTIGPFGAPSTTQDRIDLVVVRIYDKAYIGGSLTTASIEIVQGSPSSSPTVPSAPSDSITLARVLVVARSSGGAVINGTHITDLRSFTTALGGVIPCTSTARPAQTYDGLTIWETDTGLQKTWTSGAWEETGGRPSGRGAIVAAEYQLGLPFGAAERTIGHTAGVVDGPNRRLEITFNVGVQTDTANGQATVRVRDGSISGNTLALASILVAKVNMTMQVIGWNWTDNLSAGSHQFYLTLEETSSVGAKLSVVPAPSRGVNGGNMMIKDVGAS